jgi:hypothetical protein
LYGHAELVAEVCAVEGAIRWISTKFDWVLKTVLLLFWGIYSLAGTLKELKQKERWRYNFFNGGTALTCPHWS